jgi:hypothetical protein
VGVLPGASVITAKVGPLDLGTIVLRFAPTIDPHTAQIGIDPAAGGGAGGAPFILNPTSCTPMAISSTLTPEPP